MAQERDRLQYLNDELRLRADHELTSADIDAIYRRLAHIDKARPARTPPLSGLCLVSLELKNIFENVGKNE